MTRDYLKNKKEYTGTRRSKGITEDGGSIDICDNWKEFPKRAAPHVWIGETVFELHTQDLPPPLCDSSESDAPPLAGDAFAETDRITENEVDDEPPMPPPPEAPSKQPTATDDAEK